MPECVRYGEWKETIGDTFFYCSVVHSLCRLIEGLMVCMLYEKWLCGNMVLLLTKIEHYMLLCLVAILKIVVCTTRQKEFNKGEKFTS